MRARYRDQRARVCAGRAWNTASATPNQSKGGPLVPPRIRTIKPDIWRDPDFNELPVPARLLFIGLISNADDHGRIAGSDQLLKSIVFPTDQCSLKAFSGWLDLIHESGMARRYVVASKPYMDIPNWHNHQRVDKPQPSQHPAHEEANALV